MQTNTKTTGQRNVALDLLRVIAIFLVLWQHSSEYYYIGNNLSLITENAYTLGFFNSLSRICVPLFVMISGYFLLPMKTGTGAFFRKRFARILWPWIFFCVVYAVYYMFYRGDSLAACLLNIAHIPVNWGVEVGHLWYIYMLIGMYLLVPVLSPWVRNSSKREMQVYLGIWIATTFLPYIHLVWPLVWGECTWNVSPALYYFTGFGGYLVLGSYVRKYGQLSVAASLALLVVGYLATALVFNARIPYASGAVEAEIPWDFCAVNVAMMTYAMFSLVSHIKINAGSLWARLITSISVCSYAIYLAHIMLLNFYHDLFDGSFASILVKIPLISVCTFVTTYVIVLLLARLPKSRYWLGVD